MELDETVANAIADRATVTRAGASLAEVIDGVVTVAPVTHVDHRGRVFEMWSEDHAFAFKPFVYSYCFTIRPNTTKGWGLHQDKFDRYTIVAGEVVTLLYDARVESPTYGLQQRLTLSGEGVRQLVIPPGVWHMNVNVSPVEALVISFPTEPYDYHRPDRVTLPFDTEVLPVDVRGMFPTQFR